MVELLIICAMHGEGSHLFWQILHSYGFTPVCRILCRLMLAPFENFILHTSHSNSFRWWFGDGAVPVLLLIKLLLLLLASWLVIESASAAAPEPDSASIPTPASPMTDSFFSRPATIPMRLLFVADGLLLLLLLFVGVVAVVVMMLLAVD